MSDQNKKQIYIRDFNIFYDVLKSTLKIVDSAKFIINDTGLAIYGARGKIARCEITSDSIYSTEKIEFSILDLNMFVKLAATIKDIHQDDFNDFKFIVDLPFLRFESKKIKTKISTVNEDIISKWISKKVETHLTPIFEFKTTTELIKRINNHSYIFSDPNGLRIYLETKEDMENNVVYATIGNKENNLNNELTLKAGLVTFGKLDQNRKVILDLERWNLFNALPNSEILISLMDMNVLVSNTKIISKNGSYFNLIIYNSILKN